MLSHYNDFIQAAQSQPEPQRLLFVLTRVELPPEATEEQHERFQQGAGGNLEPVLCVDKLPEEAADLQKFIEESKHTGQEWDIAFASSMSGLAGIAPTSEQAEQPLQMMIERVKAGTIADFIAFNKEGELLQVY